MAQQLIILISTLDPDKIAGELPATCVDEPIECFMEQPNGFGKLLLEILNQGVLPNENYPCLSMIIAEMRALLSSLGINISQLQKLTITEEPKTAIITVE